MGVYEHVAKREYHVEKLNLSLASDEHGISTEDGNLGKGGGQRVA